ncbi:hypothetical protein K445DRAFT_14978 [Daldinia sp. EC12]|nr:hypothetical protein K445DRAFT_14978 [Daldinia sp. EC12]
MGEARTGYLSIICVGSQMHAPHRREPQQDFCPSNRHYSALAHGVSSAEVSRHLNIPLDEGNHEEVPDQSDYKPEPERKESSNFTTIFKRGSLQGYVFDKAYFAECDITWAKGEYLPGRRSDKPIDIMTGVRELLSAPNVLVISALMQHELHYRSAYNSTAYNRGYGTVPLFRTKPREEGGKRTIEFRQVTGTVNADEVVAHARIAVRLSEFACETDMDSLWKMIHDFVEAETDPSWYDIFDLLSELGLTNEARVIQRQMAQYPGIRCMNEDLVTYSYYLLVPW